MLDFGTILPFNLVTRRTPECWCALMLQLNQGHYIEEDGELRNYPERWAYFLWLSLITPEVLGRPDVWGIVDEIPYQQFDSADVSLQLPDAPYLLKQPVDQHRRQSLLRLCQGRRQPLHQRVVTF